MWIGRVQGRNDNRVARFKGISRVLLDFWMILEKKRGPRWFELVDNDGSFRHDHQIDSSQLGTPDVHAIVVFLFD